MKATDKAAEEVNNVPHRIENIEKLIFAGVQQKFLDVFNSKIVWTTSTDKVQAVKKAFKDKVEYPYATLELGSWVTATDRSSLRAPSLRGARVEISTDEKNSFNVRILPTDFTVSVEWHFNSGKDMLDTANRWSFTNTRGNMNFDIQFGQSLFGIRVLADTSVNFPLREADPDNIQEYVMTTSLQIQGFISESERINVPVIDTLEITVATDDPITKPDTVLWTFQTPPPAT